MAMALQKFKDNDDDNQPVAPSVDINRQAYNDLSLFQKAKLAVRITAATLTGKSLSLTEAGMLGAIFPSARGAPPRRGTPELLAAYSTMPWLRAVTQRISEATSSVQWRLFAIRRRLPGQPTGEAPLGRFVFVPALAHKYCREERQKLLNVAREAGELVELVDHPMIRMLSTGNGYHPGGTIRRLKQVYIDLTGEYFMLKERDSEFGVPKALWPIPTHWVTDTPTPSNPVFMVRLGSMVVEIPETEMIWAVDPDPLNPYGRGTGITQTLSDELETNEYASKHLKNHFFNRARPDFIAYVKPGPNESEVNKRTLLKLKQQWLDEHMGFWKSFKPHFINRELKIHEFVQDFRKQQLLPIMEYERNTIIQVFGFPPEIFGILESSNRSTIDAADFLFTRYAVLPRMEFQREVLQQSLVPEYDDRLILDFDSPVTEDREHILKVAQAAPWVLEMNDWLGMMGKQQLTGPEGKIRGIPHDVTLVESLSSLPQAAPAEN